MPVSSHELAHFGGWFSRTLAGGTHRWGDPSYRMQEFDVQADSSVLLPPEDAYTQRGVPYYVANTGTGVLYVRDPDSHGLVLAVPAGISAEFHRGNAWLGYLRAVAQAGAIQPALRYSFDVTQNSSSLDLIERVVTTYGYDGTLPAAVTFRIRPGVIVGSYSRLVRAITTGTSYNGVSWFTGSRVLLRVDAGAIVGGWGGIGGGAGASGTGGAAGSPGEAGGQAIRATIPLAIVCDGEILGGGGGGGGGGGSVSNAAVTPGGGGGGRGCNMALGTATLIGSAGGPAGPATGNVPGASGNAGGPFVPGSGGPGYNGGGGGGTGGQAGQPGTPGGNGVSPGGAAGAGGAAISYLPAAGAPSILSGAANVQGATVSEAS